MAEGVKGSREIVELSAAQRAIARRAAETRATVPDVELSTDVALEPADGYQLTAILIRACALALRAVPRANGSYRDGRWELHSRVNVGVVMASADEYVTATVFDAERKSNAALAEELEVLAARATAGELTAPEQSGATFTLLHIDAAGVDRVSTLVGPSHAAAVAAGALRAAPIVRNGAILPGHMLTLTLACDHRILYGSEAARFLATIKDQLEVYK